MPTELGPPFSPDYPGWPTHMSTEDHSLWLRYQPKLARVASTLYFDVRLGGDAALAAGELWDAGHMWYSLNAKRADVVAVTRTGVRIIELRNNAQANAIGRLFTYRQLWEADPKLPGPVTLELVTNANDPDVANAASALNITYTVL